MARRILSYIEQACYNVPKCKSIDVRYINMTHSCF